MASRWLSLALMIPKKIVNSPEHAEKENSSLISCLELEGFEVNPSVQSANPPDIGRPNNGLRLPWQDFPPAFSRGKRGVV